VISGQWSLPHKVRHQLFPRIRQDALRMELHTFYPMAAMAQAHDGAGAVFFSGPGADFQFSRQIFFLDDERMIAGGGHRHGQTLKDSFIVMHDRAGFAVHKMGGAHHSASESFADRLVPETNSQHWNFSREMPDQIDADARLMRRARTGGDDNPLGPHVLDLAHGHLIIAANLDLAAQLPNVLDQVVGERIVVVEYENQGRQPLLSAYTETGFQIVDLRLQILGTRDLKSRPFPERATCLH
jgi:hypothetical protein